MLSTVYQRSYLNWIPDFFGTPKKRKISVEISVVSLLMNRGLKLQFSTGGRETTLWLYYHEFQTVMGSRNEYST